ncbi:hypothetical protein P368_15445 [Comamonas thiooxydans]|nr:hypothetical protein P369_13760 [Comamonas thiooxydans]KGH03124.1 hypothetical protein P365_17375 [Comamonas thiooxydans]KGH10862.1 hypothetical protein P368_15445 [Comamonas thiooxydans]
MWMQKSCFVVKEFLITLVMKRLLRISKIFLEVTCEL